MTLSSVRLRQIVPEDEAAFVTLVSDPKVRAFLGGPVAADRAKQRFEQLVQGNDPDRCCAVEHVATGAFVGLVTLSAHKDGTAIELSYEFTPHVWGQGVAFEACHAFLEGAVERLNLSRVIAETQVANERSVRLLQRLGFMPFDYLERFGASQVLMERVFAPPGEA